MSKYDPLSHFLKHSSAEAIPMTFHEVERILGFSLPASARSHRAWWSNNPINNVMTKAWLDAGYETQHVDINSEKLIFRKAGSTKTASQPSASDPEESKKPRRHPLFGWMAGTFTIAPGTDLTRPADPEWADIAWGEQEPSTDDKNPA